MEMCKILVCGIAWVSRSREVVGEAKAFTTYYFKSVILLYLIDVMQSKEICHSLLKLGYTF